MMGMSEDKDTSKQQAFEKTVDPTLQPLH